MVEEKNFFTRFAEWQNYVHYVLLVFFSNALGVLMMTVDFKFIPFIKEIFSFLLTGNFWFIVMVIAIIDTLIHGVFWILPKNYGRWRD